MKKCNAVIRAASIAVALASASSAAAQSSVDLAESSRQFAELQKGRGKDVDLSSLREIVVSRALPFVSPEGVEPVEQAALKQALEYRVADALSAAGFKPGDIRSASARGNDLVEAMSDALFGRATTAQLSALAELVVMATVDRQVNVNASEGDGYLGSVFLKDLEVLKGNPKGNQTLVVRQLSGTDGNGNRRQVSVDDSIFPGTKLLFFLSREYYKTSSGKAGRRTLGDDLGGNKNAYVTQLFLPLAVTGDQVAGSSGDAQPSRSIGELRDSISRASK